MEFRILGPLEVVEDGNPVALGTLKERLVLGVLLLHANEFVSRERLIDELWGVAPPATARKAVNVYVSKLRKSLTRNGDDPIATADGGYRLLVEPERLDAERVRSLVADARDCMAQGDSAQAAGKLQEALASWRGPTLAGLALESFGREKVAELDELRLTLLMDRIDCDLAQGRHEDVLGELQVLVREHPLRERLRAQQMLALYRADRQAEALEAYQRARHDLIEELGIEPSESLQRLHQAILRHDPALEVPAGIIPGNGAAAVSESAEARPRTVPLRPSRTRRLALSRHNLVAGGVVAAGAIAALVVALTSGRGGGKPPEGPVSSVAPNTLAVLDPRTGAQLGDYAAGLEPGPMALHGRTLWIGSPHAATLGRYDLGARRGRPPIELGSTVDDIAVDPGGHVWVSGKKPLVTRIAHVTDGKGVYERPVVSTDLPVQVPLPGAGSEAVGAGYVWVISDLPGRPGKAVSLIDVRTRHLASTISLGRQTTALAYGYGSAWIGAYDATSSTSWLLKVRPGSSVQALQLESGDGAGPFAVAAGAGGVWVVTSKGNLLHVDPAGLPQIDRRIRMSAQEPTLLAVGAGSVWTVNHNGYSVSRIDPRTGTILRTTPSLGRYDVKPCGIEATSSAVFVAFGGATCD